MIRQQIPYLSSFKPGPRTQAHATRATQITPPDDTNKPCIWAVFLGTPGRDHDALQAHYKTKAHDAGYAFGVIQAGNHPDGVPTAFAHNLQRDAVVMLINTDATTQVVDAAQRYLAERPALARVTANGLGDGPPIDGNDVELAWQAGAHIEARPIANRAPLPWTTAQLEAALSGLNESGALGSTPPPGCGIPDQAELSLNRYEDVDAAIQEMKRVGLLDAPSEELALKLQLFTNDLEEKRADRVVELYWQQGAAPL